jgi:hypothetical protein
MVNVTVRVMNTIRDANANARLRPEGGHVLQRAPAFYVTAILWSKVSECDWSVTNINIMTRIQEGL